VLDGGPDPPRGSGDFFILRGVAAHCKVMGHSTVSREKTAEPIEIPFWMKTRVGPGNHVLDGGAWCRSPEEWAIYGGCPGHSKAL